MTRTALVTIALLSTLATPLVVNATGRTAPPEATAAIVVASIATAPAAAASITSETCRRVKVVYPAYGIPSGATACAAPQTTQR